MTMADIRALEEKTKVELDEVGKPSGFLNLELLSFCVFHLVLGSVHCLAHANTSPDKGSPTIRISNTIADIIHALTEACDMKSSLFVV